MNRIIAGFIITLLPCAALAQEASTAADQVPIEEYVPKVIIEGKWGTGPGEFGRQSDFDYDLKPTSLAVDSKGNIYILDFVNNRIQKYSSDGKHLKDIPVDGLKGPVECWAVKSYNEKTQKVVWSIGSSDVKPTGVPDSHLQAYIWPPEIQGINIVIDSKDNLYYYLKRNKDGKESGEVWQFKNDKLVKKTVVPDVDGVLDERNGKLWITQYPMSQVRTDIGEDYSISDKRKYPRKQLNLARQSKGPDIKVSARNAKEIRLAIDNAAIVLKPQKGGKFFDDSSAAARRISNRVRYNDDGFITVVSEENSELWTNYYNKAAKLVKRFRWSSRPPVLGGLRDKGKNIYIEESNTDGFKVIKYELRVLK